MDGNQLKRVFSRTGQENGFTASGSRLRFSSRVNEPVQVFLGLEKARWGSVFYVWTYVFVDGLFGQAFNASSKFDQRKCSIFRSEQNNWVADLFNLECEISEEIRFAGVNRFFQEDMNRFIEKCVVEKDFQLLVEEQKVLITPPVQLELMRLGLW